MSPPPASCSFGSCAIDDFGTGYSSLSRLDHLPIDTLKIDRSFISQMTSAAHKRKLVSVIISIARAFKMVVVAEGVESQEQLEALSQLGCDQSQGYLHSKPVTSEEFEELLRHGKGRYVLQKEASADDAQSSMDTDSNLRHV
jgi:EAL domain-containing protein (putative c-di-GMP-specific phosphodiesterase class I)